MMSLTKYAQDFTQNRKQVSTGKWLIDGLVTYLLAGAIAYMVYSLNEGRFENAGLLAVGGTLAMFVFISQSEKKAGPVMWLLTKIFVVAWILLEIIVLINEKTHIVNTKISVATILTSNKRCFNIAYP